MGAAILAKCRIYETLAQDRWDCEGTMARVPIPARWAWVRYGVVVKIMGRLRDHLYWNPSCGP